MQINGVNLNFNLYDADNAGIGERYFEELRKMRDVKNGMPDGPEQERRKYLCNKVKGFFDGIFGEGTGKAVCGAGNDLLKHLEAYDQLVSEQLHQQEAYERIIGHMRTMWKKK